MQLKSVFVLGFLANIFQPARSNGDSLCGCDECNHTVLNTMAGEFSCGDRIEHVIKELEETSQSNDGSSTDDACRRIAVTEFPDECGKCACGQTEVLEEPEAFCGCESCTSDVWSTMTEEFSCGAHISYARDIMGMSSADACQLVGGTQFPNECGGCDPNKCGELPESRSAVDVTINGLRCGCKECDDSAWNTDADTHTCGERISWLVRNEKALYPSVKDACLQVAAREFGQCSGCNPAKCGDNNFVVDYPPPANTPPDTTDDGYSDTTLTARTPLYCFPDFKNRTRWRNVWGKYTVEVKESDEACGPGFNRFSSNTVSLTDSNKIKLQFKKVGGVWEASEVRVRLPEDQMPFLYGRFSFSIDSIQVINGNTNDVIDNKLPPSLILGLFSWDDTEDFLSHENRNHEVDIEISRWDIANNEDLQFLVQPPGDPQMARFFSDGGSSYKQGDRKFAFDWRPAEIEWYGDGGESHVYSTRKALKAGSPDYTQCLPADMEIRMNLWNLHGSSQPTGMEDHHVVEVVIDKFAFSPSGLTEVPEGGVCTKDCQCGANSTCAGNVCASFGRRLEGELLDRTESVYRPFIRTSGTQGDEQVRFVTAHALLGAVLVACMAAMVLLKVYVSMWAYPRHQAGISESLINSAV